MNFRNLFAVCIIGIAAAPAFAGNPVDTYGRASPAPGAGGMVSMSDCGTCHVGKVQGRAALNHIRTPRPIDHGAVNVRGMGVDEGYGRG